MSYLQMRTKFDGGFAVIVYPSNVVEVGGIFEGYCTFHCTDGNALLFNKNWGNLPVNLIIEGTEYHEWTETEHYTTRDSEGRTHHHTRQVTRRRYVSAGEIHSRCDFVPGARQFPGFGVCGPGALPLVAKEGAAAVAAAGDGPTTFVPLGLHFYRFSFQVPASAPCSFECSRMHLRWKLNLQVLRKKSKVSSKAVAGLTFVPPPLSKLIAATRNLGGQIADATNNMMFFSGAVELRAFTPLHATEIGGGIPLGLSVECKNTSRSKRTGAVTAQLIYSANSHDGHTSDYGPLRGSPAVVIMSNVAPGQTVKRSVQLDLVGNLMPVVEGNSLTCRTYLEVRASLSFAKDVVVRLPLHLTLPRRTVAVPAVPVSSSSTTTTTMGNRVAGPPPAHVKGPPSMSALTIGDGDGGIEFGAVDGGMGMGKKEPQLPDYALPSAPPVDSTAMTIGLADGVQPPPLTEDTTTMTIGAGLPPASFAVPSAPPAVSDLSDEQRSLEMQRRADRVFASIPGAPPQAGWGALCVRLVGLRHLKKKGYFGGKSRPLVRVALVNPMTASSLDVVYQAETKSSPVRCEMADYRDDARFVFAGGAAYGMDLLISVLHNPSGPAPKRTIGVARVNWARFGDLTATPVDDFVSDDGVLERRLRLLLGSKESGKRVDRSRRSEVAVAVGAGSSASGRFAQGPGSALGLLGDWVVMANGAERKASESVDLPDEESDRSQMAALDIELKPEHGELIIGLRRLLPCMYFIVIVLILFSGFSAAQDDAGEYWAERFFNLCKKQIKAHEGKDWARYFCGTLQDQFLEEFVQQADAQAEALRVPTSQVDEHFEEKKFAEPGARALGAIVKHLLDNKVLRNDDEMNKAVHTLFPVQWLRDMYMGQLDFIRSEPAPKQAEDADGVTKVVGKTFEALVIGSADADVFLEIYAPWCGHCKQLEPEFREAARAWRRHPKVVMAQFDGSANDLPYGWPQPEGYPTLYFLPAAASVANSDGAVSLRQRAAQKIDFESGLRSAQNIISFVRQHATVKVDDDVLLADFQQGDTKKELKNEL